MFCLNFVKDNLKSPVISFIWDLGFYLGPCKISHANLGGWLNKTLVDQTSLTLNNNFQDVELAIVTLINGGVWEEALRLVSFFLNLR